MFVSILAGLGSGIVTESDQGLALAINHDFSVTQH